MVWFVVFYKRDICENFYVLSKFLGRKAFQGYIVLFWLNKLKFCGNELTIVLQICNLLEGNFCYLVKFNFLMLEIYGF